MLNQLLWLNTCSSSLSAAIGISSAATLSMFIGLPVSVLLCAISLTAASISGVATALTKKYQKKLAKVTKLVDIVTSALAVFETSVSKALNDGKIVEREFGMLRTLCSKSLNELMGVDRKIKAENRNQSEKVY